MMALLLNTVFVYTKRNEPYDRIVYYDHIQQKWYWNQVPDVVGSSWCYQTYVRGRNSLPDLDDKPPAVSWEATEKELSRALRKNCPGAQYEYLTQMFQDYEVIDGERCWRKRFYPGNYSSPIKTGPLELRYSCPFDPPTVPIPVFYKSLGKNTWPVSVTYVYASYDNNRLSALDVEWDYISSWSVWRCEYHYQKGKVKNKPKRNDTYSVSWDIPGISCREPKFWDCCFFRVPDMDPPEDAEPEDLAIWAITAQGS